MKLATMLTAALLTIVGWAPAVRAGELLSSPQWTSDQIRSARPVTPENALAFDLRTEVRDLKTPPTVTNETVTLADSFTQVVGESRRTLDDHRLCRVFTWSERGGGLDSMSCYAGPAFRLYELANRKYLAGLLSSIKAGGAVANPFWAEAELGVQERPQDRLTRIVADGSVEYRLGEDVVARTITMGSALRLQGGEGRWFARYLVNHRPMHPRILQDLAAAVDLPARLEVTNEISGVRRLTVFTITNAHRVRSAFPLPGGLDASLGLDAATGDTPKARAIRQALLAIAGRSAIKKPSAEALLTVIGKDADRGDFLAAMLDFLNLSQQYQALLLDAAHPQLLDQLKPILRVVLKDATASQLMAINDLAGDPKQPGDREAAARYLANAKFMDTLPFGTIRYVTFANIVRVSQDSEKWDPKIFQGMPAALTDDYLIHIAAYPWSANAYNDLGKAYMAEYDMPNAWMAFDLGRAVDPGWRDGPLSNIAAFEDRLRKTAPDFF